MKIREFVRGFLAVVPRAFKGAALGLSACFVVALTVVSSQTAGHASAPTVAQSLCLGLVGAVFVYLWILCLGYVHADARRRVMPPWLWTLVAAFIPNLLGFLVYFACRKPIALPCSHCGQPIAPKQPFCSWCGKPASAPLASGGLLA